MEAEKVQQALLKATALSPRQAALLLQTKDESGETLLQALSRGSAAGAAAPASGPGKRPAAGSGKAAGGAKRGTRKAAHKKEALSPETALRHLCERLRLPFLKEIPAEDIPAALVAGVPLQYAKARSALPFREKEGAVEVLTANPLDFETLEELKIKLNKPVEPVISFHHKIQEAINRVYEKTTQEFTEFEEIKTEDYDLDDSIVDLLETDDEAPVIKLVNTLLVRAVKERASDIHVEPYEKTLVFRFRIDGALHSVLKVEKRLQNIITSRIKIMGKLNIAEKRLPQDGNISRRLAGKEIDIRLSSVPTVFGERLVLRLQDRSQGLLKIDQLGFSERNKDRLLELLKRTYGVILATGPTGSGKSSSLYASLVHINSIDTNIITIENPVEQRIHGIGQIQVNPKIGLTFATGLRSIVRQDPDVIMVGEIRDIDTMKIAVNASLTGHLVLSSLHANDSAGAFPRLIDMGCEPFLIATSLLGVISQRLIRVLCPLCKKPYKPGRGEMKMLEGLPIKKTSFFKPDSCVKCNYTGYSGRTAIEELLTVNDSIRSLILRQADGSAVKKKAVEQGMLSFRDHGLIKFAQGTTTLEEVLSNTQMDL